MKNEIDVVIYSKGMKSQWDSFIAQSKNGVFLFYRDYMDYHSDRFNDSSLVFSNSGNILAVMPANIKDNILSSHGGLTFGGVVSGQKMNTVTMLKIFDSLLLFLKEIRITKILYKTIPYIYHKFPAGEDLYALFRNNATLVRRDVSSTIYLDSRIPFSKARRWCVNSGKATDLTIERSYDFDTFMNIEKEVLNRKYNVNPTHTADELRLLACRFPENIKLFVASHQNVTVAGAIIYEDENVVHTQYISGTDRGKKLYAVDCLLDFLINNYCCGKKYFDFGISTEKNGHYLNEGLVRQKEEFGARTVVYDTYELRV